MCLFALMRYARREMGLCKQFILPVALAASTFVAGMIVFRRQMVANIVLSAAYVYAMLAWFLLFSRRSTAR